ncbi:MAG: hypothetical protein QM486_01320 [Flavobacteriaceae bacterium]
MKFYIKIALIISTIVLFLISCSDNKSDSFSYFGGQIVNPKSTKVYFLKNDKILDSTILKKNNNFLFKLKNLEPGLYTFSHGNEYQYIFFEKNDSIIIRLNTWDFDESLVFSGKGAERNNFLMNLFLNSEKEDKLFRTLYRLPSKDFDAKIDSALQVKNTLFKQFKASTKEESIFFNKLAQVAITYPLYRKKENYPLYHKRQLRTNDYPKINKQFYVFRDNISLNDSSLVYFFPYRNYVTSYLYHKAYEEKYKNSNSNVALNFLENIVNSIQQKKLKNIFLYKFIYESYFRYNITYNLSDSQRKRALQIFNDNCDNPEMLKEIKQLAFDYNNIKKGAKLFNFKVINTNGDKLDTAPIFKNKKTVLYFWSKNLINANNLSRRVMYLKKRYPHLNFIGINIDNSKTTWLKSPIFNTLNAKNQFQLAQKCVMRNFVTARTPRIILLNNNAIVKNGFTVFWAENFSAELDNLEKN